MKLNLEVCPKSVVKLAMLGLLALPLAANAQLAEGQKDTILIGTIKVQPSVADLAKKQNRSLELQRAVDSLDTELIHAINATRVFEIVERKRKDDLELEQAYSAVAVDPNDKNAAQAFKMAGAKFAFLPQIDAFEVRTDKVNYDRIQRTSSTRSLYVSTTVQVVDTTTGKLLPESPSVQLTSAEGVELARMGTTAGSDQAILKLMKNMAQQLSQKLVEQLKPPKILLVTGKEIMINRGSEAGFEVGRKLKFFALQPVKDDDTGEIFNHEILVGHGKVTSVDPKKSYAMLEGEDLGVAKGCLVRQDAPAPIKRAPPKDPQSREETTAGSSDKPLF
jgi:hypothetical protein